MRLNIIAAFLVLSFIIPVYPAAVAGEGKAETKNFSIKTSFAEVMCAEETLPAQADVKQINQIVGKQVNIMLDASFDNFPTDVEQAITDKLELNKKPDSYKVINLQNGETFELKEMPKPAVQPTPTPTPAQNEEKEPPENINNRLSFEVVPNEKYKPLPYDKVEKEIIKLVLIKNGEVVIGKQPGLGLISNNRVLEEGEIKIVTTLTKVAVSSTSCASSPAKLPEPTKIEDEKDSKSFLDYFSKAENPDDAKLSFKFSIDGAKRTRRYFTNEIEFNPFRIHRLGLGGAYDLIPIYFSLKYSGDPNSPQDKMEFGIKAIRQRIFNDDGKRLSNWKPHPQIATGWTTTLNLGVETDWRFKELNLVGGLRTGLPFNLYQGRVRNLRLTPFVGFELGYKLKSESPMLNERLIARPLFGAELFISANRREEQSSIEFKASYIRRFFLKPEVFYVIDAAGDEVVGGTTKRPRDYANAEITFNYNGIISPFIQYTYGREPTKYILVNSRYQAGIKLSFDWTK